MTEPQNETIPAADPQSSAPVEAAAVPARRKTSRKALALTAAGAAVAVFLGGGVWAAAAIEDADREAPTAYWVPLGERMGVLPTPEAVPGNSLSGKLLPVTGDLRLGTDLGADGSDFVVSGEQAVEALRETRNGLTSSQRKDRDKLLAEMKLKGLAGRSYIHTNTIWYAEVRIMQADPKALDSFSRITKKVLEYTGDGREAPKVDGFPAAKCALEAIGEKGKEKIDSLDCVAVEGDVMVTFHSYGPKPFPTSEVVEFFKNQLSHLKSPGESA
ncbi:hypothetical protein OHA37_20555 [Streptomyces sp. NBC_00335]|uniref:hypothetical protein n=1 Tax=unclassified Streptomyces TaxID=2593676 RepID=UPI00224FF720|nr:MULTISPECIES: hypothetical protein [unclassified Streptomyces]MCX5406253.1 hypothetical protein [Streptomyces sp. NBC_00086]